MRQSTLTRRFLSVVKKRKRKVAIAYGIDGRNFKGSQYNADESIRTSEFELERALHSIGCISDSNASNIKKIGLSRSSRVDKGVSARLTCVGAKIMVDSDDVFDAETGHCERIVTDLNRVLPEDVKVFSVVRTRKGFDARRDCNYRQYNYLVPLSSSSLFCEQNDDEILNRMNVLLSTFCGTSNFANFTRLSNALDRSTRQKLEKQQESLRLPKAMTLFRTIFKANATKVVMSNGESFAQVTFAGEGFLYNQIRRMIGLVIAVLQRRLPEELFLASRHVKLPLELIPLAPSFPLLAHSLSFGAKSNMLTVASDANQILGFRESSRNTQFNVPPRVLLLPDALCEVEKFHRERLLPLLTTAAATGCEDKNTWSEFDSRVSYAIERWSELEGDIMKGFEERKRVREQYIKDMAAKNENAERWFKPRGLLAALCSRYDLLPGGQALNLIDVVDHMTQTELEPSSWPRDHESTFQLIESMGGPLEVATMACKLDRIDLGSNNKNGR
eukprot:g2662.t1